MNVQFYCLTKEEFNKILELQNQIEQNNEVSVINEDQGTNKDGINKN